MGCAQAKPGHPNSNKNHHTTNQLSTAGGNIHTRQVIKTKQMQQRNDLNEHLLQQQDKHHQHTKQNKQNSPQQRVNNSRVQLSKSVQKNSLNNNNNNKNKQTGLQQLLNEQSKNKQKSQSISKNDINLIQNDISPIQKKIRSQNNDEEEDDIQEEQFDTDNKGNSTSKNLNNNNKSNKQKSVRNNNNFSLQKNMRNKNNQQQIDDICLGVESKVDEHNYNKNKNNNNNKTQQLIKINKQLTQSQKKINTNDKNKKPFAHNLFYSQHHMGDGVKIDNWSPNKTNQIINNEQIKFTTKENRNHTTPMRMWQTNQQEYGSYFQQNNNNNNKNFGSNKSVKSQLPNKYVSNNINDFSLQQDNYKTSKTMTNFNKNINNKKNQFHSVLQNKKQFNDRLKESNSNDKSTNNKQQGIVKNKKSQQKQQNIDDYLIQEHDQQGSVRAPLQTSYHAPSKRTIQQQKSLKSSSKKDIPPSLLSSSKPTLKYITQLDNPAITERTQMEKEENQLQEHDKSLQSIQHLRKSSKLQTAFFKTSSSKRMLHPQNDQKHLVQQQQQRWNHNMSKKKAGPILFSQISFKDKDDSDYVPQQGSYVNGLQMSVHLNIAEHF